MSMFSDDATLPVGALLLVAAACFLALKARQEGKYLIWGLSAVAAAVLTAGVEWFWVTDEERIEAVVYDLRRSLLASDSAAMLAHLTDDVQYVQSGESIPPLATRTMIQASVGRSKFDIVRVRGLQASAGRRTRRGKAEFKVFVRGSVQGPLGLGGSGAADTTWSLGFEETKPGVWKVNRITPISLPYNAALLTGTPRAPGGPGGGIGGDPSLAPTGPDNEAIGRRGRFRFDRKSLGRERGRAGE
ncbi:hypothetical protein [Paludisphaera soli]|uniref:hypothetical protein n=1 Tax=Paludisphaera soli TaxID=2712865 RepID=UPI0013EBAB9B|nr:hypothetical protein [Paludisphaera soli]